MKCLSWLLTINLKRHWLWEVYLCLQEEDDPNDTPVGIPAVHRESFVGGRGNKIVHDSMHFNLKSESSKYLRGGKKNSEWGGQMPLPKKETLKLLNEIWLMIWLLGEPSRLLLGSSTLCWHCFELNKLPIALRNWRAQNQSGLTNTPWISAGNINRSQL